MIVFKGDTFPDGINYTNRVRFELAFNAEHVYIHEQFKHAAHPKSAG